MSTFNKSILVVEDDPSFSEALRDSLVNAGFSVVLAARFSEALHKTNNQRFSCILMDLQLETGSGLQAIQLIRKGTAKEGLNYETPIILMSGHLEADIIKAAAGKVQAVMAKPFNTESILAKVKELTAKD